MKSIIRSFMISSLRRFSAYIAENHNNLSKTFKILYLLLKFCKIPFCKNLIIKAMFILIKFIRVSFSKLYFLNIFIKHSLIPQKLISVQISQINGETRLFEKTNQKSICLFHFSCLFFRFIAMRLCSFRQVRKCTIVCQSS